MILFLAGVLVGGGLSALAVYLYVRAAEKAMKNR